MIHTTKCQGNQEWIITGIWAKNDCSSVQCRYGVQLHYLGLQLQTNLRNCHPLVMSWLVHPAGNKHVKHKICAEQITSNSIGGQRSRFKYGFRFLPIQSWFFLLYTVDLILQLNLVVSLCCSLLGIPSHLAITPMAIPEGNQMFWLQNQ